MSKVWRPERDERYAPNALARKERRHIRHLTWDLDTVSRLRTTALRKEIGRQADGGAVGKWRRYDPYRIAARQYGYDGGYGGRYGGYGGYGGRYGNGYGGHGSYGYGAYGRNWNRSYNYGLGGGAYGSQYRRPYTSYGYGYPQTRSYGGYGYGAAYNRGMSYGYPSTYYPRSRSYAGTGYNGYYPSYGSSVYGSTGYLRPRPPVVRRPTLSAGYGAGYGRGVRPMIYPLQSAVPRVPLPRRRTTNAYYSDSLAYSSSNRAMYQATDSVRRAREELRDVRAARRVEEGMEEVERRREEVQRRRQRNMLAGMERELGREARAVAHEERLENLEELRDIAASRPRTPLALPPIPSRPSTPYSSTGAMVPYDYDRRDSTPYAPSVLNTPRSPYLRSRPPSPAYSTYSQAGPSSGPLALPAPPRTPTNAGYYGLQEGRWDENESVIGDLASELRNATLSGRRTPVGRYRDY